MKIEIVLEVECMRITPISIPISIDAMSSVNKMSDIQK